MEGFTEAETDVMTEDIGSSKQFYSATRGLFTGTAPNLCIIEERSGKKKLGVQLFLSISVTKQTSSLLSI
jgi:hypothetical protein